MSVWIKTERGWRPFSKACCNSNDLQGVYTNTPIEQAQAENALRADRFAYCLDKDQFGQSFRGDHFIEPLYGAYGEKL